MSTEWHFDLSPDELNLGNDASGNNPPEKEAGTTGQAETLESYRRQILSLVEPDPSEPENVAGDELGGASSLGFSIWIESVLQSDENKYTENPGLRSLVLDTIALRLKIQDDLEETKSDPEADSNKLEEDLKIASKTINDLQALIHQANQVHDTDMSREILKLKFSLYLHQTMIRNHLHLNEEDRGGEKGLQKGLSGRPAETKQARSVRKGGPAVRESKVGRRRPGRHGSRSETQKNKDEQKEPRSFLQAMRRIGFVPILLFLTITFLGILRYTGKHTPAEGENVHLSATSPYHGEIEFSFARCDNDTFYATVTASWNQQPVGEKAEAIQKLRTKLLKDGIGKGIITDQENRRVASWDLVTISIHN